MECGKTSGAVVTVRVRVGGMSGGNDDTKTNKTNEKNGIAGEEATGYRVRTTNEHGNYQHCIIYIRSGAGGDH